MERLQEALDKLERYLKRSEAATNRQLSLSPELIERLATLSGGGKKYRSRFFDSSGRPYVFFAGFGYSLFLYGE